MMSFRYWLLSLCFCCGVAFAQDDNAAQLSEFNDLVNSQPQQAISLGQQLLPLLERNLSDNYTLHIGLSRANLLLGNTKDTITHAQLANKAAHSLNDKQKQAQAFNNMGNGFYYQASYADALSSHEQALTLRQALNLTQKVADSQNNIALVYVQMGQAEKALSLYQDAYSRYLELGLTYDQADVLSNIGSVFYHLGQLQQAKRYYEDALALFEEENANNGIAGALGNLGIVYNDLGQTEKAIELYQQALQLNRNIGASYYIAANLNNIASLHNTLNQFEQAAKFATESIELSREKKLNSILANSLHSFAEALAGQGKLDASLTHALESASLASVSGDQIQRNNSLKLISSIYQQLNQYEQALIYFQQYKKESDDLAQQQYTKKLNDSRQELELVVRDNKIALLEQEKHMLALEEAKSVQFVYFKISLLILVIILLFNLYHRRKKRQLNQKLDEITLIRDQSRNIKLSVLAHLRYRLTSLRQTVTNEQKQFLPKENSTLSHTLAGIDKVIFTLNHIETLTKYEQHDLQLQRKRLQLAQRVDDIMTILSKQLKPQLKLCNQIQQKGLFAFADSEVFDHIVHCLLRRAILITNQGEVEVKASDIGNYVKVSVRDTCPQQDESQLQRTLKSTSLADCEDSESELLYVAKVLTERHGGRMTITSNPSHGSIVSFTLPVFASRQ